MNVKYASDTYWSEKMAANYYSFDKAFGMQDYNYYQLGVVNGPTRAYQNPSTSSKFIYEYPEKEDALVIVDETTVNGEKWYKVVSDLNIDTNNDRKPDINYDFDGDGKTSMGEKWIAYNIFKECTKEDDDDDSYLYDDEEDYSWREFCDDGSEYGISPEDYEEEWTKKYSDRTFVKVKAKWNCYIM